MSSPPSVATLLAYAIVSVVIVVCADELLHVIIMVAGVVCVLSVWGHAPPAPHEVSHRTNREEEEEELVAATHQPMAHAPPAQTTSLRGPRDDGVLPRMQSAPLPPYAMRCSAMSTASLTSAKSTRSGNRFGPALPRRAVPARYGADATRRPSQLISSAWAPRPPLPLSELNLAVLRRTGVRGMQHTDTLGATTTPRSMGMHAVASVRRLADFVSVNGSRTSSRLPSPTRRAKA